MSIKTKPVDLLVEIDKVWHDLLRLQVALDQQNQHLAVARLSAVATELQAFVGNRVADSVRQEKEDKKIQVAVEEAQRLIRQADEMIKRSEGRGQKRSAMPKSAKKKATAIKINLGSLDAVILEVTLQIIEAGKDRWEPFIGKRDLAAYLGKGLFKKALIRITERYQAWLNDNDLSVNKRTAKLFKLVKDRIGNPGRLKTMFEVMLDQSLEEVESLGAEDQESD